MYELPDWIKPGASFKLYYNRGNPNNAKYEVRAVVDGRVVLREWFKEKERWNYSIENSPFFHFNREHIVAVKHASSPDGAEPILVTERSILANLEGHSLEEVRMAAEAVMSHLDALIAASVK